MAYSNPQLKAKYREYNRKYFGGRLPDNTIVVYQRSFSIIGGRRKSDFGEYTAPDKNEPGVIKISPTLQKKGWGAVRWLTLLHEMAHVAVTEKAHHGPKFQKEMVRLAKIGAFKSLW